MHKTEPTGNSHLRTARAKRSAAITAPPARGARLHEAKHRSSGSELLRPGPERAESRGEAPLGLRGKAGSRNTA